MDNKGLVDLANSLSVGGRTRHVDVCMHYLCELKDQGMIVIKHIPGEDKKPTSSLKIPQLQPLTST
jgi:hypothetical protein